MIKWRGKLRTDYRMKVEMRIIGENRSPGGGGGGVCAYVRTVVRMVRMGRGGKSRWRLFGEFL